MPSSGMDVQLTGNTGIYNQPSQVTDHSSTVDTVLGISSGLKPNEVAPSSKAQQHSTDVQKSEETTTCLHLATVPPTKEDDSGSPSSSLSSYMIPTSSTTENTIIKILQIVQSNFYPQQGVIEGTAVVDRTTSDMKWQRHSPTVHGSGDRNKCLPCRLGGCVSRCADRGPVVLGGTTGAHQCTGADCRDARCTGICRGQEEC